MTKKLTVQDLIDNVDYLVCKQTGLSVFFDEMDDEGDSISVVFDNNDLYKIWDKDLSVTAIDENYVLVDGLMYTPRVSTVVDFTSEKEAQ